MASLVQRRMLAKEDEASLGDEIQVRREDQDRINKFSRLNNREQVLEQDLQAKNKEKEDLDDLSTELELADEDNDKIPYKVGDAYFHLSVEHAQRLLGDAQTRLDDEISDAEEQLAAIRAEMTQLKVELYARFGKSINLEK